MTAICEYLFTKGTKREFDVVENGLKRFNGKWTFSLQLATCVQDEFLLKKAVKQIIETRNAAMYTAILQVSDFQCFHVKERQFTEKKKIVEGGLICFYH